MAANVFDVVEKVCTVATNFLKFCRASSVNWVSFVVGVSGFECVASVGKIYTESIGGRGKLCSWCSSTAFLSQQGKDFFFSPPWPIDNT